MAHGGNNQHGMKFAEPCLSLIVLPFGPLHQAWHMCLRSISTPLLVTTITDHGASTIIVVPRPVLHHVLRMSSIESISASSTRCLIGHTKNVLDSCCIAAATAEVWARVPPFLLVQAITTSTSRGWVYRGPLIPMHMHSRQVCICQTQHFHRYLLPSACCQPLDRHTRGQPIVGLYPTN